MGSPKSWKNPLEWTRMDDDLGLPSFINPHVQSSLVIDEDPRCPGFFCSVVLAEIPGISESKNPVVPVTKLMFHETIVSYLKCWPFLSCVSSNPVTPDFCFAFPLVQLLKAIMGPTTVSSSDLRDHFGHFGHFGMGGAITADKIPH